MILIKDIKEILSFRVYSLDVFACVVKILGQGDRAEIDNVWVPCSDISGCYGESAAE